MFRSDAAPMCLQASRFTMPGTLSCWTCRFGRCFCPVVASNLAMLPCSCGKRPLLTDHKETDYYWVSRSS
jgi:hypothetical protein